MTPRPSFRNAARHRARLATGAAALVLALVAPRVYAQVRLGVVDIRRAVTESSEGRAASDAIKQRYDSRQTDLNRRTKAIENLKRSIERPTRPLPQATLQRMAQQYQQQVGELQQLGQAYTQELQGLEAELTKQILTKMQPIVREIGQRDNYQLIVDEQVVHFSPSNLNLTDQVIQQYNQRYPARGPVQLPDSGPPPPSGGVRGRGPMDAAIEEEEDVPPVRTVPADGGPRPAPRMDGGVVAPQDAGPRRLPGVFFRADAGPRG